MVEKSGVIAAVCDAVAKGEHSLASSLLRRDYPFAPESIKARRYGPQESTRVFIRDGFLDRYTGDQLIFPPVLRVLSLVLPTDFPFHPNWKTEVTHPSFWEVGATIDHLIPVTRGGSDGETNWVTTSMARNSAKMNGTIEELGWTLQPPGEIENWDGLMGWFLDYAAQEPAILQNSSVRSWHRGATACAMR